MSDGTYSMLILNNTLDTAFHSRVESVYAIANHCPLITAHLNSCITYDEVTESQLETGKVELIN